jgi:hypothetical protein
MDSCKAIDMIKSNLTGTIVPLKLVTELRARFLARLPLDQQLGAWQRLLTPQ